MAQQNQAKSRPAELAPEQPGLYVLAFRQFIRNRFAVVGIILLMIVFFAVLFADVLTPYDPIERSTPDRLLAPTLLHPMGTDTLGRDILSRVLYGGRVSLQVGFFSVGLAVIISVPLGLIAGYFGGWIDNLIMRVMDIILAFPGLIFAIWLVSLVGSSITNVIVAIAFFTLPGHARLARGITLSTREMEYVMAARGLGAGSFRILLFHILPAVLGPMIVITTLGISGAIVTGASLSFLGLGVSPPTPEWGAMLADGRGYLRNAWWMALFPGFTITFVVLALNVIGDALRDALDPRTSD